MVEFERLALKEAKEENCAVVYALLALAQTGERIAACLEKVVEMAERDERKAQEGDS